MPPRAMGEHWAHNAAHITGSMDEEIFLINRLGTGFDARHPLHSSALPVASRP